MSQTVRHGGVKNSKYVFLHTQFLGGKGEEGTSSLFSTLKRHLSGFLGGAVVESPPADAGDTGSCPGPGRSHMPRSGWARGPWPLSLRVRSRNGRGHSSERPAYRKKKKKNVYFEVPISMFPSSEAR